MANLITFGRLILLFVTIGILYLDSFPLVAVNMILVAIVFWSDGLDGFVARRRKSTSDFGAVIDIAGDRVVENAYWIVFAHLGLVGVWAPLLVMTRGFMVDAMRGMSYSSGKSAFGENTMMRSPITRFLTASRFMRAFYGTAKALGFIFLTGVVARDLDPDRFLSKVIDSSLVWFVGWFMVYSALALTVIRGIPVVIDSMYYVRNPGGKPE